MKKCEGIYSLIGKVNHKSAIYGFELLKEENIHPRQMPLIIHLKKCEGCTQKELAEKMQVKPSTLNVMIGRMEKNGYIEKKQDEKDSRKSRIYFTEKGRSICEDGHKKFVMIQEKLQENFTKEEQEYTVPETFAGADVLISNYPQSGAAAGARKLRAYEAVVLETK